MIHCRKYVGHKKRVENKGKVKENLYYCDIADIYRNRDVKYV